MKKLLYTLLIAILFLPNLVIADSFGSDAQPFEINTDTGTLTTDSDTPNLHVLGDLEVDGSITAGSIVMGGDLDMNQHNILDTLNVELGSATTNAGDIIMMDGDETGDDTLTISISHDGAGDATIATSDGDITINSAGGNIDASGNNIINTLSLQSSTDTDIDITGSGTGDIDLNTTNGDVTIDAQLITDETLPTGSSNGHLIKTTLGAGTAYSGTMAGLTVKNYDADATVTHSSGENTGLAIFYKQLSAMLGGGESSIISAHTHASTDQKLTNGMVLYPKSAGSAFAVRAATIDYGYDLADASNVLVTTADFRGHEGDIIFNNPAGTWNFGNANLLTSGYATIGPSATSVTNYENAMVVASYATTSTSLANYHVGIFSESASDATKFGVGFYSVGMTSATKDGYGNVGIGKVSASADVGDAYGGYYVSASAHTGGDNVALFSQAQNGDSNYSFYGEAGEMYNKDKLVLRGTTNDGSTNVQEWEDLSGATLATLDTDGLLTTVGLTYTGFLIKNGLTNYAATVSVVDDAYIDIADATTGWGEVFVDKDLKARFSWDTDGSVLLDESDGAVIDTDTDAYLCVFDNGTSVRIRNRLGSTQTIKYSINY